ncbi:MAG: nucleotide sugar dehydrogenase [Bacteroidota bacterium]
MNLKDRIRKKSATIGVIGLGYVGLPLAVEYAAKGFRTVGIDVDQRKVDSVNSGENYIDDVDSDVLAKLVKRGRLSARSDYECISSLDVILITVPTPFTKSKEPDISYILAATEGIAKGLRTGQLVILKSTTFPNTTEAHVLPILERRGLRVGKDFFLAFSPERIDPGNKKFTTANTPVVVGGVTKACTELACLATEEVVSKAVPVSSPNVAEMEKLLENIFRSVNIALVNELAQLCDRMGGIDIWEVIESAKTKPFGYMPFYPGPGIGGHCILIDPYYLAWVARQYDFQMKFITLAAETNEDMPFYVKNMILREISLLPVSLTDAKILILGVAFKRDVDDTRHSPALKVMELLLQENARNISYNDPHVPSVEVDSQRFESVPITKALLSSADCVVITTDHSDYDYRMILRHSKLVVDTRNATRGLQTETCKIVRLGNRV